MQVYRTFFKIARKHLPQCILYFVIFMVLMIMMSSTAKDTQTTNFQAKSISISIVDKDQSKASQALIDYLDSMHEIVELRDYEGETIQDNLFYQNISYALIIPEGFEKNLLNENLDDIVEFSMRKDSAHGYFINTQIDSYLNTLRLYLTSGLDLSDAITATNENIDNTPDVTVEVFEGKVDGENSFMFYFFQYYSYIILMILVMGLSPILVAFQKKDLGDRITCAATTARSRTIQIGLGALSYSLIAWFLFVILAIVWLGPSSIFSTFGWMILLNSFVFTMFATAITLFISTFSVKDNALNLISNILGLGMAFMCGVFVPQWLLADNVLAVSKFLPAFWYVKIINMLSGFSGEPYNINLYWQYIGIECIFVVAAFAFFMVASKTRKKDSL